MPINSSNMDLPIPIVGVEPGPDYASDINACLTLVDQHDHTPGKGVAITVEAINILDDLDFHNNFATSVAGVNLDAQLSTPSISTVYVSGTDLFFIDGLGNDVRITQDGAVAGTPGSISNLVAPASASYEAINQVFIWQSAVDTAANLDAGSLILRNLTLSSFGMTISPPAGMTVDTTVTLPEVPTQSGLMQMDNTGAITIVQAPPSGSVMMYAGTVIPSGWLLADGSVVSQVTYADLYSAIGTTYNTGGEGAGNFRLPDMQGLFVRGVGSQVVGGLTYTGSLAAKQNDTTKVNGLSIQDLGHSHAERGRVGAAGGPNVAVRLDGSGDTVQDSSYNTVVPSGSNTSIISSDAETRPANIALYYMIKT